MADKQIEVEIITQTDLEELDGLETKIDDIQSKADEGVPVNVQIEEAESELEAINAQIEDLQNQQVEIEVGASDADFEEVTAQLEEAISKAEELQGQLDALNNQTVSPDVDTSGIDEAASNIDNATSSMDNLTAAAAGLSATMGFEKMITTADNINTSWNRLGLTFEGTGVSMDTLKDKASAAGAATGRSGGTIRDYFNQMGMAGVTNADLLGSSFEAIAGKAYQSNQSIESMEQKIQKMVMTGNAAPATLARMKIGTEDLAAAMGVSADEVKEAFANLTPEERLQAITQAMGDGAEANAMYKDSYAGLKDQADAAMAGLVGAVGQAILPVVIPALQTATDIIKGLTDTFKGLPEPVQSAIGGLAGIAAIGVTAVGTLGVLGNIAMTTISPFKKLWGYFTEVPDGENLSKFRKHLQSIKDIGGSVKDKVNGVKTAVTNAGTAAKNAGIKFLNFAKGLATTVLSAVKDAALALKDLALKVLTAGYNALKSAAMWVVEKGALVASKIAEYGAAAAQWALNVAMSANPIGILIIAIAALVAALGYLYFNNEQVKGAIDGLGQAIMGAGQAIYDGFLSALQWVQDGLTNLWNYITQIGAMIWQTVVTVASTIVSAVQTAWDTIWNAGMTVVNNIMLGLQGLWNYIMTLGGLIPANASITGNKVIDAALKVITFIALLPAQLAMHFTNMIGKALGFGNNFSQKLISGATNAVNGFINKIKELPGMIQSEFSRIAGIVSDFITSLPQKVWDLGASVVDALKGALGIGSPGHMYWMFEGELTRIKNAPDEMSKGITTSVRNLGTSMVDSFNPELSYDITGNASLMNAVESGGSTRFGDVIINVGSVDSEDRVQEIVEAVRRELSWNNLTAGRSV